MAVATSYFNRALQSASFGWRDFVDVVIIAFLIYMIIGLLRETHSVPAFAGVLSLIVFYGITLFFDLPLARLVLKSFFGIFFVFLAIIFQKELRRFFSSFGFFGIVRKRFLPSDTTVGLISNIVFEMARKKTGALIVFPGREPIDRHLEGGSSLYGNISEDLILSIFDETSPGHDGALIIEGNRVKKFATHLPLADKLEKVKRLGLRHRAALGLAERTDAFVIVVSQERGAVTVAKDGEFSSMFDENELRKQLFEFLQKKFPARNWISFAQALVRNLTILGISFVASLAIWFLVNSQFVLVQRNFVVSPELKNVSSDYIISDIVPQEVTLTIKGRSFEFESLKPEGLKVSLDLGSIKRAGRHQILIFPTDVKLPIGFSLINIDPKNVSVQVVKNSVPAEKE